MSKATDTVSVEELLQAADRHWPRILEAAGFPPRTLEGGQHVCPKCHVADAVSVKRDEVNFIIATCSSCHPDEVSGIGVIEWSMNCTLSDAKAFMIGQVHDGIPSPITPTRSRSKSTTGAPTSSRSPNKDALTSTEMTAADTLKQVDNGLGDDRVGHTSSADSAVSLVPSTIKLGSRVRKDMGDLEELASSIKQCGLLQDILVTRDGILVAGARRLAAWIMVHEDTPIPVKVLDSADDLLALLYAERDENTCRKSFNPVEAIEMGKSIESLIERATKAAHHEMSVAGGRMGGQVAGRGRPKSIEGGATCPTPKRNESLRTKDKIAKGVGLSRRTYEKAEAVVDSGSPTLIEEMASTGKVDAAFRKLQHLKNESLDTTLAKSIEPVQYDVIVIDGLLLNPGMSKEVARATSSRRCSRSTGFRHPELVVSAADGCAIWLRATRASLSTAFALLKKWGLELESIYGSCHAERHIAPGLHELGDELILVGRVRNAEGTGARIQLDTVSGSRDDSPGLAESFYDLVRQSTSGKCLAILAGRDIAGFTCLPCDTVRPPERCDSAEGQFEQGEGGAGELAAMNPVVGAPG